MFFTNYLTFNVSPYKEKMQITRSMDGIRKKMFSSLYHWQTISVNWNNIVMFLLQILELTKNI